MKRCEVEYEMGIIRANATTSSPVACVTLDFMPKSRELVLCRWICGNFGGPWLGEGRLFSGISKHAPSWVGPLAVYSPPTQLAGEEA